MKYKIEAHKTTDGVYYTGKRLPMMVLAQRLVGINRPFIYDGDSIIVKNKDKGGKSESGI